MNVALNILRRKKCGKKSSALAADTYAHHMLHCLRNSKTLTSAKTCANDVTVRAVIK